MPRSSLLISHYNDFNGLQKCIESSLASVDSDFEILVYDDCSDSVVANKLECIRLLDARIKVFYGIENRGCGYGFNFLSRKANSDILHFVGADDLVHPYRIAEAADFHLANKWDGKKYSQVPLLATGCKNLDNDYRILPKLASDRLSLNQIRACMYFYTPIVHGSISITQAGYFSLEPFQVDRRAGVDYLFFCMNNNRLAYCLDARDRYYIRLRKNSLTRSVSGRSIQLESHDLGMYYLWNKLLGPISLREITDIRRLFVTADDFPGFTIDARRAQRLIDLLNKLILNSDEWLQAIAIQCKITIANKIT